MSASNRRERKKQETRQNIIKVAMYLFRKQGFEHTSMEQIAEEADISKGTLYNYFPVKESIISLSWQNNVKEIKLQILELIQLLPDTGTRLHKTFMKAATELFSSKQDIYRIYLNYWLRNLNNQASHDWLKSGFEDIFPMIIKLGQQSGDVRKDIHAGLMARHLEVMFLNVCISWLADPRMYPLEKSLEQTVSIFIEGAGTGRKPKNRPVEKDPGDEPGQEKLL